VAFSSATTAVCTSGGTNGATFTFIAVGTCTVNANQAGNTNWNAATQVQQSFVVSNPLTPTAITIANGTGTLHKADQGDTIKIVFNQSIDLSSVCSTWTSSGQTVAGVTVTLGSGNGSHKNDLTFAGGNVSAANCAGGVNIGQVDSNTNAYNTSNSDVNFTNSTVTWNSGTNTLTISLGTGTAGGTASANSTYDYTPDPAIALASNPAVTVTGTASSTANHF
jgi:hypothetical protein